MTKDYSKEVADLQKDLSSCQGKIFRLMEKVLNERTAIDLEKNQLERQVKAYKLQLTEKEMKINELMARLRMLEENLIVPDKSLPNAVVASDDANERARLSKTINSLQKKLDEETVEVSIIVDKIQDRAETHGIDAANGMYDTVCLLLDDVAGWKKNKAGLDKYFREYRKRKSNIVKINGGVDQMILENNGTVNHN